MVTEKQLRIYIDIDDTICTSKSSKRKYVDPQPIRENIRKANQLYDKGHYIVYWTGRAGYYGEYSLAECYDITKKQLDSWGCKYHELRVGINKDWDLIIDNTAINSYGWENGKVEDVLEKNSNRYKVSGEN